MKKSKNGVAIGTMLEKLADKMQGYEFTITKRVDGNWELKYRIGNTQMQACQTEPAQLLWDEMEGK